MPSVALSAVLSVLRRPVAFFTRPHVAVMLLIVIPVSLVVAVLLLYICLAIVGSITPT